LNAKRDANEGAIVDTLQARGFVVKRLSGKGCPDLLVARRGSLWLCEVKAAKGTFTPDQVQWLRDWTGPTPIVLRSVEDALTFPKVPLVGRAETQA